MGFWHLAVGDEVVVLLPLSGGSMLLLGTATERKCTLHRSKETHDLVDLLLRARRASKLLLELRQPVQ